MTDLDEHHSPMTRRSMAIAAFSTVVEWYDFTLYLYLATVLSRVFFGGGRDVAADHARRVRGGLSDAADRGGGLRPYRRPVRAAAHDAAVGRPDDGGDDRDGGPADLWR